MRSIALSLAAALALMSAGPARASSWHVDHGESRLWIVGSQGGSEFEADFTAFEAEIDFDPAHLDAARIDVAVDLASFSSDDSDRDEVVQSADFFNVAEFPLGRFAAETFSDLGGGAYEAQGTLDLRGAGHPLSLPFSLTISDDGAVATGAVTLLRLDWGVGQGDWSSDSVVAFEVTVNVHIVADRAN